jgi:very-short-patch-repair endonuclease
MERIPPFEKGGLGGILKPYNPILKPYSRNLRSNMTDAEQLLWSKLRRKQILGVQFYRQKPIAGFIVDFYCAAANLVIELDGSQHAEPEQHIKDKERDQKLKALGLDVLRFNNHQVLTELAAVMDVVFDVVEKKIPPNPPFSKGGIKTVIIDTNIQSIPENSAGVTKQPLDIPTFENDIINSLVVEEVAPNSTTLVKATPNVPNLEKSAQNAPSFEKVTKNTATFEKLTPNTPSFEKAASNTPPFVKGGPGGILKKGDSL